MFQLNVLRIHLVGYFSHDINCKFQTCREGFVSKIFSRLRVIFMVIGKIQNLLSVLFFSDFLTRISLHLQAWFFFIKVSNQRSTLVGEILVTIFFVLISLHSLDSSKFPKCDLGFVSSTHSSTYFSLSADWVPWRSQPKSAYLWWKLRLKQQYLWSLGQIFKCPKHTRNDYSFDYYRYWISFPPNILCCFAPWRFQGKGLQL